MKNFEEINFAPLHKIDGATGAVFRSLLKSPLRLILLVLAFALGVWLATEGSDASIYIIVFIFIYISNRIRNYKDTAWREFAIVNNWSVTEGGSTGISVFPPSLIAVGHGHKTGIIINGEVRKHDCQMFLGKYTVGHGKNSRDYHYTVVRVPLAATFPHVLLDGQKNSTRVEGLKHTMQRVSLEGDFDKHFRLYIQKGEHVDALSVITPDVMQTLIDNNLAQDIELSENYIYFMTQSDSRGLKTLPGLLKAVNMLADELVHKAQTINYVPQNPPGYKHQLAEVSRYFKSGDKVMEAISRSWILIIFLPLIFAVLLGMFISLIN